MIEIRMGKVVKVLSESWEKTEVLLDIDHPVKKAVNYNLLTGKVSVGDMLYLNTTAGSLSLGTGGSHFVITNASCISLDHKPHGHGMKVRYTPMQVQISFIEEENKAEHDLYNVQMDLKGKVVIFGELHSMLPPACAFLKRYGNKKIKTAYIMTDHAALPLCYSDNVSLLKQNGLLDLTITTGNAFGGDKECVNIYTALQTASSVADVIIVTMGPGITGTGTKYGFSGLELALYIDLASRYGASCIYIPRISFADRRPRHYGISHHSLTVMSELLREPVFVALPIAEKQKLNFLLSQIRSMKLPLSIRLSIQDGRAIEGVMKAYGLETTSMGRGFKDDPCFFLAIGASCAKGLQLLSNNGNLKNIVG